METTVWIQVNFFLWSLAAGLAAGLIYDLFRLSRRMIKTGDIVTNIEDIVFLLIVTVIVFVTAYIINRGEMRWYGFLSVGLGFCIYRMIFKDRILNISVKILDVLIKIIFWIIKIILWPVAFVYKILRKPFKVVAWYVGKTVKKTGFAIKIKRDRMVKQLRHIKHKK